MKITNLVSGVLLVFCLGQATGFDVNEEEPLKSVKGSRPYELKADEDWPEEVAHLFANRKEGEQVPPEPEPKATPPPQSKSRVRRWTEWVSKKLEFREDSWDEPPQKKKDPDPPKFIAYEQNGTFIMSRCSSSKGALTLVIACPQPRGSKFHRVVFLRKAYYGWSQHDAEICQYVEGDCTIRYEFAHKQIMRPTTPQTTLEWKSLGPQYFCNSWDGNGRQEWEMPQKRWCAVGLKRSSQTPNCEDDAANAWGNKYLYTWGSCGGAYDWFDYLHIEYQCDDVDEPIDPEATRPYHYRPKPDCGKKDTSSTVGPTSTGMPNATETSNSTIAEASSSED